MSSHQALMIANWGPTTFFLNGHDHSLVHRNCAEERQQVKQSPVGRRPASPEQARCAAEQGACAHREDTARACRLLPYPAEHLVVLHQGLLTEAARHMQHIELWRVGQGRIRRQPQALQVANWFSRPGVDCVGRVRDARQHLERSGEVDLV